MNKLNHFSEIREQLKDAPSNIKISFNSLIEYFSTEKDPLKDTLVKGCRIKLFGDGTITLSYLDYKLILDLNTLSAPQFSIINPENEVIMLNKSITSYSDLSQAILNKDYARISEGYIELLKTEVLNIY